MSGLIWVQTICKRLSVEQQKLSQARKGVGSMGIYSLECSRHQFFLCWGSEVRVTVTGSIGGNPVLAKEVISRGWVSIRPNKKIPVILVKSTIFFRFSVNKRALGPWIAHLSPGTNDVYWPVAKEIS